MFFLPKRGFGGIPVRDSAERLDGVKVALLGVASSAGAPHDGAENGPRFLRAASRRHTWGYTDGVAVHWERRDTGIHAVDLGDLRPQGVAEDDRGCAPPVRSRTTPMTGPAESTSEDENASPHTVLGPRTFLSFAGTMFAIDVISVGYGAVDLAFIAPFGIVMVAAVGLGDLVTLLYMAFFAGVVDVYAARLARAEGRSSTWRDFPRLIGALFAITGLWTVVGIAAATLTPLLFEVVGSDRSVADVAAGYVAVRMVGVPFTLTLAAISVTLRILGRKRASIWMIVIGFFLNALFNAALIYGPVSSWTENPVMSVAAATVVAQILTAGGGGIVLSWHLRRRRSESVEAAEHDTGFIALTGSMLRTSLGVGLRQMNNYAAAVVPFMLISRLDVGTIAAAAVATKVWTLYCRVPQAALSTAGVFIAYARGRSERAAHAVANRGFRYVIWPSLAAAMGVAASVPLLARLFGGDDTDMALVWILSGAYLVAAPAYVVENFSGEVLTLEQRAAWLSVPSTVVTYAITIPLAALGVLLWHSAVVAVLSAAVASLMLSFVYWRRTCELGYRFMSSGARA
jgi:MATE family multidrug resistance protein